MQDISHTICPGEIWHHYKGNDYRIIALSRHSEDLSLYVVYEALYDNTMSQIWHSPLSLFLSSLELDGQVVQRFTRV